MASDIKYKIKSFYEIMKGEGIQKLEITSRGCSVYIKRKDKNENVQVLVPREHVTDQGTVASENNNKKDVVILKKTIKSPITGVFYRSSFPLSDPFVNEGDVVEIGETVCIIEAMKVMNEIKAIFKVKILRILVENGKSVVSEQDLFEVEKM